MQDPFDSISVVEILKVLWKRRLVIICTVAVGCVLSVVYALSLTHFYRAEVVVVEVRDTGSGRAALGGQLAGLASLAGVNLGSLGAQDAHTLAVLRSRRLAERFVRESDVIDVFRQQTDDDFEEIFEEPSPGLLDRIRGHFVAQDAHAPDPDQVQQAMERRAVNRFASSVRNISQDRQTGLIRVAMEWTTPEIATRWANEYIALANQYLRERDITQAQANLEYLNQQRETTPIVELERSLYSLIEGELKTLMLANAREEYGFRIIDHAVLPDRPAYPSRRLIAMAGGFASGILALILVFLLELRLRIRADNELPSGKLGNPPGF